jgi:hypothetical protein
LRDGETTGPRTERDRATDAGFQTVIDSIADAGAELLGVAMYAVGAAVMSGLGIAVEYDGLRHLVAGDTTTAVWLGLIGLVVLAIAADLTKEKLLPAVSG